MTLAKQKRQTDEELAAQLEKLPSSEEIEELVSVLRVATLRELAAEIVNGSIEHAKGKISQVEYLELVNSWIATAEETVAAGRNVSKVAARRRKDS